MIRALVDTGCTTTIADPRIVSTMSKNNEHIIAVDGSEVMCSVGRLRLSIAGHDVNTQCLVLSSMLEQFKLVIGMDIIQQLGGVTITKTGQYNGNGLGWNQSYIINCLLIKLMIM